MLSLIGLPPTLGLVGKFYLFRAVIEAGYYNLAVVGVITSLISAFYYLRVVVTMYMKEGQPEPLRDPWLTFTWVFAALATAVLSLMPGWLFDWASRAVLRLF
jgi:NADH-quinone oxidoreductase subunit N